MLRPKRAGAYSKQAGGKQATGERNDGGTLWCAMLRYVALWRRRCRAAQQHSKKSAGRALSCGELGAWSQLA